MGLLRLASLQVHQGQMLEKTLFYDTSFTVVMHIGDIPLVAIAFMMLKHFLLCLVAIQLLFFLRLSELLLFTFYIQAFIFIDFCIIFYVLYDLLPFTPICI